jgi:hypothetical protein
MRDNTLSKLGGDFLAHDRYFITITANKYMNAQSAVFLLVG